ncbi:MAG: type II/IV secretion system protein [Candidatus Omnitrophica bacterium]|nr:type II/IV secretion system protein [Candidatus Omnitrophota bacterium]
MSERVEETLLKNQMITAGHLDEARVEQKKTGEPLGSILVRKGFVREEDLSRALAEQYKLPFIRFGKFLIQHEVIEKVPPKLAMHYKMVPIKLSKDILTVAISNPQDIRVLDDIRVALKARYRIEAVIASETDIVNAIKKYYGLGAETVEGIMESAEGKQNLADAVDVDSLVDDIEKQAGDASVVKLVNQVLLEAWGNRATDIHIEPYRSKLQLRYRVDGMLYPAEMPPQIRRFLPAIISRIKIMSNLNIVERRLPQDGRASIKVGERKMDLRISVLPTPHGESVVIRILPTSMLFSFEELGLSAPHRAILEELLKRPYGIIFVTGPTGAGKSTTLYTSLSQLNTPKNKIITIEDPIEYEIEGITQIQVMPQIGLTFAQGLRSMLRHDPDVMMVGEVRDFETAELAIRIALTGHLVFSTLHTNDAASAVTRLLDMGVDSFLIVSSVECFIAQRLVRLICTKCHQEDKRALEPGLKQELTDRLPAGQKEIKLYIGEGCEDCNFSGYKGRTGIHEFLVLNSAIKKLVIKKSSADDLKEQAIKNGMITLRNDGWDKVLAGKTSIDEILRVTQVAAGEDN